MPFSIKRHVVEPVKRFLTKLKAATLDKLPQKPRRTAWERIEAGFMESRWEQIRSWFQRRRKKP